jgi:hypothetical protein
MFSLRKQDGVALYARKVLIQEYNKDLLPDYFRFIQGVVDSEDIPLNVSREAVQSSRVMSQLKKLITSKLIEGLKTLAKDKPDSLYEILGAVPAFHQRGYFDRRRLSRSTAAPAALSYAAQAAGMGVIERLRAGHEKQVSKRFTTCWAKMNAHWSAVRTWKSSAGRVTMCC